MVQFGERIWFHKIEVEGINPSNEEFKESLSVIMMEREQFHTLPRVEVCEAKVRQGRP